jgi:cytochrome c55X
VTPARALLAAALLGAALGAAQAQPAVDPQLRRGWQALRTMDCARCHGRDYDGWAAPSLLASVRDAPRERFERIVLDGDVPRGMPGYRGQPVVAQQLDAIYAYLLARADGRVPPGNLDAKR